MRLKLQDGISLRSTMKEKIESGLKIDIILFYELTELQIFHSLKLFIENKHLRFYQGNLTGRLCA